MKHDLDAIARAAAALFAGPNGDILLAHLRRITIERRTAPEISEAELRHLEGQRALVAQLESLIARGREGPAFTTGENDA